MAYSPPGSSIHGIFQAGILEWVAISSSRGSSRSKDQTHVSCVSCTGRGILSHWRHLGSPIFRQGCFTLQGSAQRSELGITKDWGHLKGSGILTIAGQPRFGPADEFSSLLGSPLKPSDSQTAWNSHEFPSWFVFLPCLLPWPEDQQWKKYPSLRCSDYIALHMFTTLCTSNLQNSLFNCISILKRKFVS